MILTTKNNKTLAAIKRIFNSKIYKMALYKANKEGEEAVITYVQQFVTVPVKKMLGIE